MLETDDLLVNRGLPQAISSVDMQPGFRLITLALFTFIPCLCSSAEIRSHPAPFGEALSTNFTVTVGTVNVPVYLAKVAPEDPVLRFKSVDDVATSGTYFELASFASLDCRGGIEVSVRCPERIKSAKVLPSSRGITPVISEDRVRFRVSGPGQLTLEINGDWVHSLHLFVNELENDVPDADNPNVIFFGPGIHEIEELKVSSGKTVYVADGAILRAKPTSHRKPTLSLIGDNITLRGRGIIDGSLCPIHTQNLLFIHGTNIVVEGIILRDSSTWTVPLRQCEKVKISNVKLFGSRANADGIDICNSRDVEVANCFLRTLDDLVVVKTDKGQGTAENIRVNHCVLWNEVAHALSIGAELREPVNNVRFSNCDVIHDKGREWTLRVFHCDSAVIRNIEFENIRVEESRKLISLWIGRFVWTRDPERGHIKGVTFKNIDARGNRPKIELKGFDSEHAIEEVKFQNVRVNGKAIGPDDLEQNQFVRNISVSAD